MSDNLIEVAEAFETIKQAMIDDHAGDTGSYGHSWHCNIAMMCYDAIKAYHLDSGANFTSFEAR